MRSHSRTVFQDVLGLRTYVPPGGVEPLACEPSRFTKPGLDSVESEGASLGRDLHPRLSALAKGSR